MRPASAHPSNQRDHVQPSKRPFSAMGKVSVPHALQPEPGVPGSQQSLVNALDAAKSSGLRRPAKASSIEEAWKAIPESEEKEGDRVAQSVHFSKENWRRKLQGSASPATAAGTESVPYGTLPSFEDWRRAKEIEQHRQEWKPKENKSSGLRRKLAEDMKAAPKNMEIKLPETLETLQQVEQRIRTKLRQQSNNKIDVGVEPIMLEIQLYDILCSDVLKQGDLACPAISGLFRLLWDSFLSVLNESLRMELRQIVALQEDYKQVSRELLAKSREQHEMRAQNVRLKSTLERKSAELVKSVRKQTEMQNQIERLRRIHQQEGMNATFDPLALAELEETLEETSANTRHASAILRELEALTAAQGVKDTELEKYAEEQQRTLPARFRAELERLLKQNQKLDHTLEKEREDLSKAKDAVSKFMTMVQNKPKQRENSTPRPEWDDVLTEICPQLRDVKMPSMHQNQNQKSKAKSALTFADADYKGSSTDKVKLMAAILSRLMPPASLAVRAEVSREAFFEPLGNTKDVPAFLRSKNRVRNRNITKKDTEQLIRAIWSTKHEENEIAARRGNPPPSLHDHIFQHLRVRFGNFSQIIAEWGYNLMEGCRRYAEDADIELFKLVVSDEVGEEVVQDQFQVVSGLQDRLKKEDLESHSGGHTRELDIDRFTNVLQTYFPFKGKLRLAYLLDCAYAEHPCGKNEKKVAPASEKTGKVKYEYLFMEDENFDQGPFLEGVRDQYLQERTEYLIEVERQLRKHVNGQGHVSAHQCRQAIRDADPQIPEGELNRVWCAAFRTDLSKPPDAGWKGPLEDFIKGLRRVAVRWHSPFIIEVGDSVIDL